MTRVPTSSGASSRLRCHANCAALGPLAGGLRPVVATLLCGIQGGGFPFHGDFHVTGTQLRKRAQYKLAACSAAGVDGWMDSSLRSWCVFRSPSGMTWRTFNRMLDVRCLPPGVWHRIRCALAPKDNKLGALRPISVASLLWCLLASALLTIMEPRVQSWARKSTYGDNRRRGPTICATCSLTPWSPWDTN